MTRWSRCQLTAGRGQKFIQNVALQCATACRVVTSIYTLRLKRWRVSAGFYIAQPACQFTRCVSDNHNKFAIAVTRARVDVPSFLIVIPPSCALPASLRCVDGVELCQQNECQNKQSSIKSGSYATGNPFSANK